MEYWFDKLPTELRMDGRTGAVRSVSGYVEVIPDTSLTRDESVNNWALGHVMIRMGDHMVYADSWVEARVKHIILSTDNHVDRIRAMWGQSHRDEREGFRREAAYA